jgi:hypothetical protein
MTAVVVGPGVGLGFVDVVPGTAGMRMPEMFFEVADSLSRFREEESRGVTELSLVDGAGVIAGVVVE